MPYGVHGRVCDFLERVGRSAPFAGGLLPGHHETSRPGAIELSNLGRDVLSTAILGVSDLFDFNVQIAELDRIVRVVRPPDSEEFSDALPPWIAGLDSFDPLDWVAAAERNEWVAAPLRPLLEASDWLAPGQLRVVVPSPAPDSKDCAQERGAVSHDVVEEAWGKWPRFRILEAGVHLDENEPAR
jgi:hypothetical protein